MKRLLFLLTCATLLFPAAVLGSVSVSVVTSPSSIPADGKSTCQVLVTVLDQTGAPVPDGEEVKLTVSSGDVTPVVFTSGGRAVGIVTSSTSAEIVSVTALVSGQSSSAQVSYLPADAGQEQAVSGSIDMQGGSLAYSVDADTVFGSGGVSIECGGITISAIAAQVCQATGRIRAQGEVKVSGGRRTLTGDALAWDTQTGRIYLLDSADASGAHAYTAGKLDAIDSNGKPQAAPDLSPVRGVDGDNWIVCERLTVIPSRKVLFFKAGIYVRETRILTLPYYVYSYDNRQSFLQQVRVSSNDGVLVDFPLYYRMVASGPGALKLRYAADGSEIGGYSRPRKGLSMGLEQGYSFGGNSRGTAFIDSVGTRGQAYELAHQLSFGPFGSGGQARLSARYQPFSSYARGLYGASLNVSGGLGKCNYSLYGSASGSSIPYTVDPQTGSEDFVRQSTGSLRTTFRPKAPLQAGLMGRMMPSLTFGYGTLWNSSAGAGLTRLYQTLGANFSRVGTSPGRFNSDLSSFAGLTLAADGSTGASLSFSPSMRTNWTGGYASMGYSLNLQGGTTDLAPPSARHQLSLNLGLTGGGKWTTNSMISYGLDTGRLNLFSRLNYNISRAWRFESGYDLYRYTYDLNSRSYSYGTSYLKTGIYRTIGSYEIGLAWSPDGRNYGIERNKHLWLEFGGRGF